MNKTTITIVYRSGAKVRVSCDDYTVTKNGPDIVKISVVAGKPKALFFGIDQIESVWEEEA